MMDRKGQSALEFLMTYGWAILVVLAAIGALSYFGVLSPANFIGSKCVASDPISCQGDPLINSTHVAFTIANGVGSKMDIAIGSLTISSISGNSNASAINVYVCPVGIVDIANPCVDNSLGSYSINDGDTATIVLSSAGGATFTTGQSLRAMLTLTYADPSSNLPQSVPIQISGKID